MLRLIVASETSTPLSSSKATQCSLKVRSGLDFSCSGSHSLKASPFTEGLPGIFIVSTPPVWRLLLSQRLMVDRETPKSSATSFLGMPRSIAASVFNLRSFEYAFMESILVQVRYLCKSLSEVGLGRGVRRYAESSRCCLRWRRARTLAPHWEPHQAAERFLVWS